MLEFMAGSASWWALALYSGLLSGGPECRSRWRKGALGVSSRRRRPFTGGRAPAFRAFGPRRLLRVPLYEVCYYNSEANQKLQYTA
jgi:hypothetical protein